MRRHQNPESIELDGITYAVYPSSVVVCKNLGDGRMELYVESEDCEGDTDAQRKECFLRFYSAHENIITQTYDYDANGKPKYMLKFVVTRFQHRDTIYDDPGSSAYLLSVLGIADVTTLYKRTQKINSLFNA